MPGKKHRAKVAKAKSQAASSVPESSQASSSPAPPPTMSDKEFWLRNARAKDLILSTLTPNSDLSKQLESVELASDIWKILENTYGQGAKKSKDHGVDGNAVRHTATQFINDFLAGKPMDKYISFGMFSKYIIQKAKAVMAGNEIEDELLELNDPLRYASNLRFTPDQQQQLNLLRSEHKMLAELTPDQQQQLNLLRPEHKLLAELTKATELLNLPESSKSAEAKELRELHELAKSIVSRELAALSKTAAPKTAAESSRPSASAAVSSPGIAAEGIPAVPARKASVPQKAGELAGPAQTQKPSKSALSKRRAPPPRPASLWRAKRIHHTSYLTEQQVLVFSNHDVEHVKHVKAAATKVLMQKLPTADLRLLWAILYSGKDAPWPGSYSPVIPGVTERAERLRDLVE